MKLNYQKRRWMIIQYEKGMNVTDLCSIQNVTRKVFYDLLAEYKQDGEMAFLPKQVGRPENPLPKEVQELILKTKKQTGYGMTKLGGILDLNGIHISKHNIHKVLDDADLIVHNPKRGKRYHYKRWERDHSNSLWQTDFCWISKLDCWLCAWLDDHSRFITVAEYLTEATTDEVIRLFEKGANRYGYPRETISDRGSQFYSNLGETCRFLEHMKSKEVHHIYASVKKPTTCGKIERFWGTHNRERWNFETLRQFINYYNYKRAHMSLSWYTPYAVYMRDMKSV